MVYVAFVDMDEAEGRIDADLTVEYDGRYCELIRAVITDATSEYENENAYPPPEDLFQELLLELYENCPLRSIEIVEAE